MKAIFSEKWQKHEGMTQSEWEVYKKLSAKGNTVIRKGWPDFLIINESQTIFCVEVKHGGDKLSEEQITLHKILNSHGIKTVVVRDGWCEDFQVRFYPKKRIKKPLKTPSPP
jgi:hypothetical protein